MLLFGIGGGIGGGRPELGFGPVGGDEAKYASVDREPIEPRDGSRGCGLASILATARVLVGCSGGILSVHQADRRIWEVVDREHLAPDAAQAVLAFDPEGDPDALLHDSPECRVILARMPGSSDGGALGAEPPTVFQMVLDREGGRTWLLTLVRDRPLGPFSPREVTLLASLGPAFRAVLREARGNERPAGITGLTLELLDCLAFGVLLVDADQRVLWSNAAARSILASSGALQIVGRRLKATDGRCNLRLREIVHELANTAPCAGRALGVSAGDGPPIQLGFVRLREAEGAAVTAVFLSCAASADVSARVLRDLYDLTPVEAEVARLICRGSAPAAAAAHLRLSIHTVRDYLKPIFQKMGVRRQADMVRVAATFAGVFDGRRRLPPAGARAPAREWN